LIICGDLNIIRHDSDIYVKKEGRPGLTDRERESFEKILTECKLNDSFRKLYPLRQLVYSHWTDRCGIARKNNWGSRMDYFLTSEQISDQLLDVKYHA
jgi:exodeoxyribonuclease-3